MNKKSLSLLVLVAILFSSTQASIAKENPAQKKLTNVSNLIMSGKYDQAIKKANKELKKNPNNAFMIALRGSSFYRLKQTDKALADCNKAISMSTKVMPAYFTRATIFAEQGKFSKSLKDLNHAIALNPKNSLLYTLRANVYRGLGSSARAKLDEDKVKELKGSK